MKGPLKYLTKSLGISLLLFYTATIPAQQATSGNFAFLIGKWKAAYVQECEAYDPDTLHCFDKQKKTMLYTLEFFKNGKYVSVAPAITFKGKFEVKENHLLLKSSIQNVPGFFDQNGVVEKVSQNEFIFITQSSTEGGPVRIKEYYVRIK